MKALLHWSMLHLKLLGKHLEPPNHVELLDVFGGNITTYSDPLMQVLELLISNAINHAEPNGQLSIKVSCYEGNNFYEVQVEDNGIGVTENELTKIFNPFLHSSTSTRVMLVLG